MNASSYEFRSNPLHRLAALVSLFLLAGSALPVMAQEPERKGASAVLMEEIVVTARKREESIGDVPLSITAFGSEQIEALRVRDLTSLSVGMPNVALDEIGTTRGTANFSIRGLGVNSSIPSIDPTVGVFIDGVYMGLNNGIVFDMFDLESIEVLRGPQGILFGRNVTGGAILINTKKPGDEFEASFRGAAEGGGEGMNYYVMGSIGGPVSDNVGMKITAYSNEDDGWYKNLATGADHGAASTWMVRPVITMALGESTELTLRYEHSETDDDGPASQSHTNGLGIPNAFSNFARDSHNFAINEPGFQTGETDFFNARADVGVGGGDGTVTAIFGWRDYHANSLLDVDASVQSLFHAVAETQAEQSSFELRYNGTFNDKLNLTTGVYYFTNEIDYAEGRRLLGIATPDGSPALTQDGGGNYDVDTLGLFVAGDYDVSDRLTLTTGVRYTDEEKTADIASLIFNVNSICSVVAGTCPIDFRDKSSWSNVSPKVGFTYHSSDTNRIYGHWTRGFRSGGYNLRNTAVDTVNLGPGPFNEEKVDNFELGLKTEFENGRFSGAVFYNQIDDMQRELNLADPVAGVVQVIKNTADADILGVELDGLFSLTDQFLLMLSVGYIDASYDTVRFDISSDGVIDAADKALALPRAAELTYSLGFTHDAQVGDWGYMTTRVSFAHRDESAYTDNNLGFILAQDILDASVDFHSNSGRWSFGLYGKNLLDEVKHGGDTQLPAMLGPVPLGGTFSPLAKGQVYGADVRLNFGD
ncbi:MAG: TonB-dependent receptor [Woeseia sp.]